MGTPLAGLPYCSGLLGGGSPLRPGGPALTRRLVERAGFRAGQRVADLGCGSGASTALLSAFGCHAIGVDTDHSALNAARRGETGPHWVAASGERLPFATACLDGILAECSLSVMGSLARALEECRRVLAPDGRIAVSDVYARQAFSTGQDASGLPRCIRHLPQRDTVLEAFAQADFDVEHWEDHSDVLKVFLARLIFEQGSTESLWAGSTTSDQALAFTRALSARRPGYFLLLARAANR